jgi:hypothetical protein
MKDIHIEGRTERGGTLKARGPDATNIAFSSRSIGTVCCLMGVNNGSVMEWDTSLLFEV